MAVLLKRKDAPQHIFGIPELDFSSDLFAERIVGPWFRLGAHTIKRRRSQDGVEAEEFRQTVLIPARGFRNLFDHLESVGNVFSRLGKPGGVVSNRGGKEKYHYDPFHRFEVPFSAADGEPLVFLREDTSRQKFFINPDLWMYLELEEKSPDSGIWWDPRRGVDALRHQVIDDGHLEVVELRTDYLLKYLQARQLSLLVGHYRQLLLFNPSATAITAFVNDDLTIGSAKEGAKAILQNWGLQQELAGRASYLQRRLHLWFQIKPPKLDIRDPWSDPPPFDPFGFVLPTGTGLVAPARWSHIRYHATRSFAGVTCDFMDRTYFRQEVLIKYQSAAGFTVRDDGSVICRYWSLSRSTARLGNELLSTAIGDFAEGVPLDEWLHWKQYSVDPPSDETAKALVAEIQIPDAVNAIVESLNGLNAVFAGFVGLIGIRADGPLWRGALDSLAGRQLKWVYPAAADDDEFLKRATLASTLFIDGLSSSAMRRALSSISGGLHHNFDKAPQTLGGRNLLQRIALVAILIENLQPDSIELTNLVRQAEAKALNPLPDLQDELERAYKQVRHELAPLAFLYDLRIHGGLAHPPSKESAADAAAHLGLPKEKWHRTDYLQLLALIADGIRHVSEHLATAGRAWESSEQSPRREEDLEQPER